jgi:multiple sugar transport system permease protein
VAGRLRLFHDRADGRRAGALVQVAAALLWLWIFNPDFGLANTLLNTFGLGPVRWLFDITWVKPSIVLITLWGGIGTPMIVFLAGLHGVPESLYEAAAR